MRTLALIMIFELVLASCRCELANASDLIATSSNQSLIRGIGFASKRYPEAAVAEFNKCKNFDQANAKQLAVIAQSYYEVGDVPQCLNVVEYALLQERVKRDNIAVAQLLGIRGSAFATQNRIDEAVSSFKLAAIKNPNFSYVFFGKAGELLMTNNRRKDALPLLAKAVKPGRMNGFIYKNIGQCYLELSEPNKAIAPLLASIKDFEEFRKHDGEAFLAGLVQSHKYLVKAYTETSNAREAALWQKRLDVFVNDLNKDMFGR